MKPVILPVIHYADDNQAMRNAERAVEAGCHGVMLIDMTQRNQVGAMFAAGAIKRRWPTLHVGINHLGHADAVTAAYNSMGAGVDSTWVDDQLTFTGNHQYADARRLERVLVSGPPHQLFCAVAFKYQAYEPDPVTAARRALDLGFIPTTSGIATGAAADVARLAYLRSQIGLTAPLAIASGVTPENVQAHAPHVSHILVSTGVSSSFHEFDPARLRALVVAAA